MKSILIGSVDSSRLVLEEMIASNFPIDMVFSLHEQYSKNVSGYEPIHELAKEFNIPYVKFKNINDESNVKLIESLKPDFIFVIGLSQLVSKEIINLAKKGTIGFHPTPLPKYRGRAPIVWQILLGVQESKCTLFFIDEGTDSGDIIAQEDYFIGEQDYAMDVQVNSNKALKRLLHKVLPKILDGSFQRIKQDEDEATYLLKRTPEDGMINWNNPVASIQCLIRAVSKPYPGAYSLYQNKHKFIFWKADILENSKYYGIPGQIVNSTAEFIDVICVDGILRVYDYTNLDNVKITVGNKFK